MCLIRSEKKLSVSITTKSMYQLMEKTKSLSTDSNIPPMWVHMSALKHKYPYLSVKQLKTTCDCINRA